MNLEKLVRMANQIAANLDYGSDTDKAVAGVADHMHRFWTPMMLEEIADGLHAGKADLSETAAQAVEKLAAERRSGAA